MNLNKSEENVLKSFKKKGFKVLRNGSPDFVFYKEEENKITEVLFVEVKSGEQKLNEEQKIYKRILEHLGLNYKILRNYIGKRNKKEHNILKRKKIFRTLDKFGRLPTSRIGAIIGMNSKEINRILEELVKEKKLKKVEETNATYWELKTK